MGFRRSSVRIAPPRPSIYARKRPSDQFRGLLVRGSTVVRTAINPWMPAAETHRPCGMRRDQPSLGPFSRAEAFCCAEFDFPPYPRVRSLSTLRAVARFAARCASAAPRASSAGTARSGRTPTPSQFVPVTVSMDRAFGTVTKMPGCSAIQSVGCAPPRVVSPTRVARDWTFSVYAERSTRRLAP
jgi:hypothetical protein